ncbi:ABC transporter ATP-binding protein [Polymorphum gilvum]|uniref:Glutathione import ATP-binding protein GsiA n=1 Tax=Polymorphum gilvum (strain LMG 25793 / CGMCC 1.9160 / SL003B-26A1) TaxID=991905 RepID=F2IYY4_POLGS|nr:ABC transporter ATP-binding protein [Polymorphum gilvum]ADZ70599.1 Oligopeptide/dipeptide ABC transporter, ATPase subunit [Polymorphum gilvum SL003B-26A1]
MTHPVISVEDLCVRFGSHDAVKGLSFAIAPRETLALVGESGSGKSATALSILRLIEREGGRIASGRILLRDGDAEIDLTALSDADLTTVRGNHISMVFQEPMTSLNPVLTIGDQVGEVFIRHRGMGARQALAAARDALDQVRIPEPARRLAQYPHELSGGLRQRVMIAMALACRPRLLIADEPSTALDVTTQAEILDLIRSLQEEIGMAILFITHDMGVVAEIADRVAVLRNGVKVEEAPVHALFAAPKAAYSRQLMAATPKLGSGTCAKPAGSGCVLEVKDLSTRFPLRSGLLKRVQAEIHAVSNVSFSLAEGETLGLVGESGCGKSTLARSVLRLIEPAAGTVRLAGQTLTGLSADRLRPARRHAQMIFQDPFASLNPRLPVHELVTEPARIHGLVTARDQRDLAVSLIEKVGLEADAIHRYPHQFSGGQRQRLCIARALSVKPKLIVADEAVSALDVSIARQVTDLMLDLQEQEGLAFLFISHDMAVVERLSHRIAVMYGGRIVEMGPSAEILANPRHSYTKRLLAAVPTPDPERRRQDRSPVALSAPVIVRPRGETVPELPLQEIVPGHFVRTEAA